jgi:uncharacterized protein (TIGR03118 family)
METAPPDRVVPLTEPAVTAAIVLRLWTAHTQEEMMARRALALAASVGLLITVALPAAASNINAQSLYSVHNLQSDVPGVALGVDPDLVNAWGIVASPTSPWWVSAEGTEKSTLYNGNTGLKLGLVVSVPDGPTGVVFNGTPDFKVDAGTGPLAARFIFATEDGRIAGWNGVGSTAITAAQTPDAIYLGLANGASGGANYLYAANFSEAQVDVFDKDYALVHLAGDFTDPGLPEGYAPFGVQNIGGEIFVAYAKQNEDGDEEVAGEGFGYVSAFGTDGSFHGRVASAGELNAPWGLANAPATFGKFGGDLLVGNFGDGRIHAFKQGEGGWEEHGVLKGTDHRPIEIEGLWGIGFGNGANAGPTSTLFFAAGPEEETHGLFGSITAP